MIAHFVLAGQSNMDQWFHAGDGAALEAFKQTYLALNPQYSDVQFFDAARGGSALLSGSAAQYAQTRAPDDPDLYARIAENYWYDESTGSAGPNLTLFTERLETAVASGIEFQGVIWAQGEADTTYVGANGAEDYTAGLKFVLDELLQASAAPQVHIQALGDRAFYSETLHGGSAAIRDAQQEVADSSDDITLATTIFDLDLRDSVHLTTEGYEIAAQRMAVAISTGETSPATGETILLNANTILIQIALAPGQQFTGQVNPAAFTILDGTTQVTVTSASITPAGLLRLETLEPVSGPSVSYGGVAQTVSMPVEDVLYATGPNGTAPILPFDLVVTPPSFATTQIEGGLRLEGGALSERITGLSGDDVLYGNAGHDTLIGGWGADQLHGGQGKDTFVMGRDASLDTVHDFNISDDAIGLMGTSAADLTFHAHGAHDLEIRGADGQAMVLNNIDLAASSDIIFHTLGTDGSNDLTGWAGDDRIFAYGGDDTINSGAGYDRITTGTGADIVMFGAGFDTNIVYDFDIAHDSISLLGTTASSLTIRSYGDSDLELRTSEGDRLILRDVSLSDNALVTIIDPEPTVGFLIGTDENDVLRGTQLNELIDGQGATDRLYGGGGSDVFVFGEGSDLNVIYDFARGEDRILIDGGSFEALTIIPYKTTDTEIRLETGDRLVLRDVDVSTLSVDDFIFDLPEEFA